jgi:signal transduction histidine kinase
MVEDDRVVGAIEISRDITGEINRQTTMIQQEKLASIGRLAAGVAHEINNPLTTILTTSMLLQEDLRTEDPMHQELETIANETLRCRKIVTALLDFARQSQPVKQEIRLQEIIAETALLTRKQAAFKDVAVTAHCPADLPPIEADKGQIHQALINLVVNAIAATDPGGKISISCNGPDARDAVTIAVSDTGVGIPAEELEKVFEPFFTTRETGTGLGLSITSGIVAQHGGSMEVKSTVGQGTTFTIRLPRRQGNHNGQ